jgi:hypothetical protein
MDNVIGDEENDDQHNDDYEQESERNCAADFSLLNLPKGKSLGRSKPATNS